MYHRSGLKRAEVRETLQNTWWKNRRPFKSQIKWGISHTNIAQITYRMSRYDCDFSMRFWTQVRNRSVPSPAFLFFLFFCHHFLFFFFPFLSFSVQFESLGCFKDSRPRSLPLLVENLRKYIDWNDMTKTVRACAELVQRRGLAIFGIQFYGECWSGVDARKTYDKYGPSKNCWSGVGREGSYFVYKLRE